MARGSAVTDAITKLIEAADDIAERGVTASATMHHRLATAIAPARAGWAYTQGELKAATREVAIQRKQLRDDRAMFGAETTRLRAEIRAAEREACLRDIDAVAFEAKAAFGELWALDRIRARIRARADKEGER